MDNQDAASWSNPQTPNSTLTTTTTTTTLLKEPHLTDTEQKPPTTFQREIFDENTAFSFRKKKSTNKKPLPSSPSPFTIKPSSSSSPSKSSSTLLLPTDDENSPFIVSKKPSIAPPNIPHPQDPKSLHSHSSQEQPQNHVTDPRIDSKSEWDLVWRGSWIIPTLEPVKSSSATSTSTTSRRIHASLKKATLDNKQQAIFQESDGSKFQSIVTELRGFTFAISRNHQHESSQEKQFMSDNTEMHLIAKIRQATFPFYLLKPGCPEPCRIFISSDQTASVEFLKDLFDLNDIDEMEKQYERSGSAIGPTSLILRVASKPLQPAKKKPVSLNVPRQDDNPFLLQTSRSTPTKQSTEPMIDPREKFFKDTAMFLICGKLSPSTDDTCETPSRSKKTTFKEPPIISFFAYPLIDHAGFMDRFLLNSRSFDHFVQEAEESQVSNSLYPDSTQNTFVRYQDPDVDSIMNGSESGYNSETELDQPLTGDMNIDEDESLHQEMEILRALERSKSWSPYTVLTPPTAPSTESNAPTVTKDITKDRILSRSITGDGLPSGRESSTRSSTSSSLSRYSSMDAIGKFSQSTSGNSSTKIEASLGSTTKPSKKGISRMKSPSRAPQQPLDVTTESLRRKLLGTTSVRGENSSSSKQTTSSSSSSSTPLVPAPKSIEAANKSSVKNLTVSALAKINISKDHEEFKECVKNLYRSVTFAMRKDISTKKYSIEELEQLLDKHAGLL